MDDHISGRQPDPTPAPAPGSGRRRRRERRPERAGRRGRGGGGEDSAAGVSGSASGRASGSASVGSDSAGSESVTAPPPGRRRRPDDRPPTRRQVVAIGASSLAVLAVAGGIGGYSLYHRLESNLRTVDIGHTPRDGNGALNVLLIGSDSRAGDNAQYGHADGARSDTTMVLHVSADRTHATVASIPRDSMVQIPSCVQSNGASSMPQLGMFNSAYATGGPACTVKTVESLTNLTIDHVLVVDFTGFKNIVDAIGGIPITLDKAVDDPDSHLNLPAGTSIVNGEQALAFVRARHNLGNGSDIGRMGRQQQFLDAALHTMATNGTLDDPAKLYRVLDAATKSLTTDPALGSLSALANFANDVKRVPRANITYLTVPWQDYPADPNRVEFAPAAQELFDDLRNDTAVPSAITSLPGGEQKAASANGAGTVTGGAAGAATVGS